MIEAGDQSCAMEATSHGAELGRLAGVRFGARIHEPQPGPPGLPRNAGTVLRGEALFVTGEPPPAALNTDDPHGRRLAVELRALGHERVITFGFGPEADIRAEELELSRDGTQLTAAGIPLRPRLLGRFNVENVLAAVAVARLLELPDEAIARGVESVRGIPGRFEVVEEGQPFSVIVDYAHTPDSLETACAPRGNWRRGVICVFGAGGDGITASVR